jgi:hypothetical protein
LANEDHKIYDTEMVSYTVQRLLHRQENGAPLCPHIDAVIYLTERHATKVNGGIGFPITLIEGSPTHHAPWKREVYELFIERWPRWNCTPVHEFGRDMPKFSSIDHIPEKMRRQEIWELQYRRNPYMNNFTKEQMRNCFDEAICIQALSTINGSPYKPDQKSVIWSLETMSHLVIEMGRKALPITEFPYVPARSAAAARRLHLPEVAVRWFETDMGRKTA